MDNEKIWDNGKRISLKKYKMRINPENIFDERIPEEDLSFSSAEYLIQLRTRGLGVKNDI